MDKARFIAVKAVMQTQTHRSNTSRIYFKSHVKIEFEGKKGTLILNEKKK